MGSSTFYETVIGGVAFQGLMSGEGPAIAVSSGQCAPLGGAISIRLVSEKQEVAERIPASAGMLEVETLREVGESAWWVVKYRTQPRINLRELSDANRRQLASEFGIDLDGDQEDARATLFFSSPAFHGLVRWVQKHPAQARQCSRWDAYLSGWYERALKGSSAFSGE